MRIPYKGHIVSINKEKYCSLSFSQKLEYIKSYFVEQSKYIKEQFINYWIGWVDVKVQEISVTNTCEKQVYEVHIYAGRHRDGQTFGGVSRDICQRLIDEWEHSNKKLFNLHLDLGCGMCQQYDFTRKQKDMLIKQLKPLMKRKWHERGWEDDEW